MTDKIENRKSVDHAIIWAGLILASSLLIEDEKTASTMLFLLIGGWVATVSLAGGFKRAVTCEASLYRRLFGSQKDKN